MTTAGRSLVGGALAAVVAAWVAPGCSLGQGTGSCSGVLDEPTCWVGKFDLKPDFFAAVPTTNPAGTPIAMNALEIRVQRGGDYQTFSDGLSIEIDDVGTVRGDGTHPSLLGKDLVVSLPVGVEPPGVPITPVANPAVVHAALYLGQTCRTQNVALYAMDAVSVNPDGSCGPLDGGDAPLTCGAPAVADAGSTASADAAPADAGATADGGAGAEGGATARIGTSTINFTSLFDGNQDETNAAARLTEATFTFYLADPREICPGGLGPPPRCRGYVTGNFRFYFQRGTPAQPFP